MVSSLDSPKYKTEELSTTAGTGNKLSKKQMLLGGAMLLFSLALCIVGIVYRDFFLQLSNFGGYSLLGILVVSLIAGSTVSVLAIPVPYWLLVFTLPSVLASTWGIAAPLWVGMASALGASLGHIPTYAIGYGGSTVSQRLIAKFGDTIYHKSVNWAKRHGSWAVFATSALVNPLHLPMTIAIGALHYPPVKWFLLSLLGNLVKSMVIAFAGYYGVSSLLHFLGV